MKNKCRHPPAKFIATPDTQGRKQEGSRLQYYKGKFQTLVSDIVFNFLLEAELRIANSRLWRDNYVPIQTVGH